jgi:hypothetical protein
MKEILNERNVSRIAYFIIITTLHTYFTAEHNFAPHSTEYHGQVGSLVFEKSHFKILAQRLAILTEFSFVVFLSLSRKTLE